MVLWATYAAVILVSIYARLASAQALTSYSVNVAEREPTALSISGDNHFAAVTAVPEALSAHSLAVPAPNFARSTDLDPGLWGQFCDDTACDVNCGQSLQVVNPGCVGELGRNSIMFHHADVLGISGIGNGDGSPFALLSFLSTDCSDSCQNSCLDHTDIGSSYCVDISAFNASLAFQFLPGTCAANNCSSSSSTQAPSSTSASGTTSSSPSSSSSTAPSSSPKTSGLTPEHKKIVIATVVPGFFFIIAVFLCIRHCCRPTQQERQSVDLDFDSEFTAPTLTPFIFEHHGDHQMAQVQTPLNGGVFPTQPRTKNRRSGRQIGEPNVSEEAVPSNGTDSPTDESAGARVPLLGWPQGVEERIQQLEEIMLSTSRSPFHVTNYSGGDLARSTMGAPPSYGHDTVDNAH